MAVCMKLLIECNIPMQEISNDEINGIVELVSLLLVYESDLCLWFLKSVSANEFVLVDNDRLEAQLCR
jgi:hypothetical protein